MTSQLVRALGGEQTSHTPIWFMRQAGRSLPEYRELRAGTAMLDACRDPEMVAEITLQPVRRHDVDAAIFFSDIVVPLQAAGVDVEIVAGKGPVIANPIRTLADVAALPELDPSQIPDIAESIARISAELPEETALIGFAGAPFTLASYLIEGGPSKNHEKTKSLMAAEPETFSALLAKLARISSTFIDVQLSAGATAFQLFDSWAGYLSRRDYVDHVLEHSTAVFSALAHHDVPSVHFGVQTGELLAPMSTAGSSTMGVDYRVSLADAATRIQPGQAIQGNLDPALLFAPWEALAPRIRSIVEEGLSLDRGFVFNLGHGVLPDTDPDVLGRVVAEVHRISAEILGGRH